VPQDVQQGTRVDAEVSAAADDLHAADDVLGRGAVVGGAEQRHPQTSGREPFGDPVDVPFGTPAFGVGDVPPVDEEDIDRR
jgi:hypothetical protein